MRSASRWSRLLVPVLLSLAVAGLGAATTSIVRDAETRARVESLEERRLDATVERQRLSSGQVELDREIVRVRLEVAEQLRQVSASLARIEARLDAQDRPRARARGEE